MVQFDDQPPQQEQQQQQQEQPEERPATTTQTGDMGHPMMIQEQTTTPQTPQDFPGVPFLPSPLKTDQQQGLDQAEHGGTNKGKVRLPLQDREGGDEAAAEEEEKRAEQGGGGEDWHASVRGPSISMSAKQTEETIKTRRKQNRLSIDGTQRFRKVVTFRNSLVQTRTIGRRRGRNSFLPWFSKASEEHTQEILEEQERQKAEKAAKKQAKKEEKAAKKAEKERVKAEKRASKKAKKLQKSRSIESSDNDDDDNGDDAEMSMSLSVGDLLENSRRNNNKDDNDDDDGHDSVLDDSFAVGDDSAARRRRSSVGLAILDTMRKISGGGSSPKRTSTVAGGSSSSGRRQRRQTGRVPLPAGADANQRKNKKSSATAGSSDATVGDYDWASHLRSSQQKDVSSSSPSPSRHSPTPNTTNTNTTSPLQKQQLQAPGNDINNRSPAATALQKQKSKQDMIEEEEEAYEQDMEALPKTNPPGYRVSTDLNSSFAITPSASVTGPAPALSNKKHNASGSSIMSSSMDISGESFADPNTAPLSTKLPRNPSRRAPRGGRKKSFIGSMFGSSKSKKKKSKDKQPGKESQVGIRRQLTPPNAQYPLPTVKEASAANSANHNSLGRRSRSDSGGSMDSALAEIIAMENSKNQNEKAG